MLFEKLPKDTTTNLTEEEAISIAVECIQSVLPKEGCNYRLYGVVVEKGGAKLLNHENLIKKNTK